MSEDKGVLPMEKKRLKKSNWPFYAALVLDFYLLPALIVDTGSGSLPDYIGYIRHEKWILLLVWDCCGSSVCPVYFPVL